MNKITIQGRLTKDVELSYSTSGTAYSRISVAVDRRRTKDDKRETDFFNCIAFGKTAEFISKYFYKGDGILVSGSMEANTATNKNGDKVTYWSLMIADVEFPMGKGNGQSSNSGNTNTASAPANEPVFNDYDDSESELPF